MKESYLAVEFKRTVHQFPAQERAERGVCIVAYAAARGKRRRVSGKAPPFGKPDSARNRGV